MVTTELAADDYWPIRPRARDKVSLIGRGSFATPFRRG
jgi:hypothetical protein